MMSCRSTLTMWPSTPKPRPHSMEMDAGMAPVLLMRDKLDRFVIHLREGGYIWWSARPRCWLQYDSLKIEPIYQSEHKAGFVNGWWVNERVGLLSNGNLPTIVHDEKKLKSRISNQLSLPFCTIWLWESTFEDCIMSLGGQECTFRTP